MHQGIPVFRNVAYNFLSQVWFFILPLVTAPYIVRHLGVDAYGVLSLATAIVGYLAVLDLGMGTATIKYIADAYTDGDMPAISKIIGTSIVIYAGMGLLGAAVIAVSADFIVTHVLKIPADLVAITLVVLYFSSFGFLVNMPLAVFSSIPSALQRFDIVVKQNIVLGTVAVLGQVVLLAMGYSLRALVAFNVGISIVGIWIFVLIARRLLPRETSFRPRYDASTAKRILQFSVLKFFSVISGQIVFHLDKLLIAVFLPLASVSYYVIPLGLAQRIISIIPNITTAVFPAVSQFRLDPERLNDLYLRVSKGVLIVVLPLAVILVVLARPILLLWMGPDFAIQGTVTLQYLATAFFLASFAAVPTVFVEGLGRPGIPSLFAGISAVLNLGFALLLIPRIGIAGPALALILNSMITVPSFIDRVNRRVLRIANLTFVRRAVLGPLLTSIPSIVLLLLVRSQVRSLPTLGAAAAVACALYGALCLVFGVIDATERRMISEYWQMLRHGGVKNA